MDDSNLPKLIVIWICAIAALVAARWWRKTPGTGLVLAYVLNLWMIHWVAPALYLLPGYQLFDLRIVALGLEQSVYAVIAFAAGCLLLAPVLLSFGLLQRPRSHQLPDRRLATSYLALGAGSYVIMSIGIGALPSATAVFATGQQLVVVGLTLCCWQAWRIRNYPALALWLGVTLLLPLATIITRGFIGYGAVAALIVLVFVAGFFRSPWRVALAGVLVTYLGLSVYVTYMRDRNEIRESVWGGQSLPNRVDRLGTTFKEFEWFDLSNTVHLNAIDTRLNQSFLVGLAVSRLSDIGGYAHGQTLWEALLALVPRALWPDKPLQAGSGNMVTEYTGLTFAAGTSVGIGQVMEFYVNFATFGVIVGFMLMGVLVTVLDTAAAERLAANDLHGFVLWYLPGISLLQVGGSLVEVTASAAASLVVALIANKYLDRLQRSEPVGARLAVSPRAVHRV
jgi:hypothetical protein